MAWFGIIWLWGEGGDVVQWCRAVGEEEDNKTRQKIKKKGVGCRLLGTAGY